MSQEKIPDLGEMEKSQKELLKNSIIPFIVQRITGELITDLIIIANAYQGKSLIETKQSLRQKIESKFKEILNEVDNM